MSAGDLWRIPGGHKALELDGSTRDVLRVSVIAEGWAWQLKPAMSVPRVLCEQQPSRYHGDTPKSGG